MLASTGVVAGGAGAVAAVPTFLGYLIFMLVSAKLLGELAERLGQPAVVGELLAGVLLGPSVLGLVPDRDPVLGLFAEIGVVILLFEIGLETNLRRLLRVGGTSAVVAVVGVVAPFALGLVALRLLGLSGLAMVVAGAALTATSVGITARVLSDLGRLQEPESQIVLGAAVIDDVIGLIILAVVGKLVAGVEVTGPEIVLTTAIAFGFLGAVLLLGRVLVPPLFRGLARIGNEDTVAMMALVLAFLLAWLAYASGSALIIGAFAAGLVLAPTPQVATVQRGVVRLGHFFVPIFFVSVGAAVDVRAFLSPRIALMGVALVAVAVAGKLLAGYAPFWFRGRKLVVGIGMIPRGEVGLIFAQMGLAEEVIDRNLFSVLTFMVMVTTFLAPPLLKAVFPSRGGPRPPPAGVAEMMTEA